MNSPVSLVAAALLAAATVAAAAAEEAPPYRVVDGTQVDARTYEGWRTWRAMACERCHGNEQQGLVGPALTDRLKTMTPEAFKATVLNGRVDRGMPNFGGVPTVVDNIDGLYSFLKGRADGAIKPGRLQALKEPAAAGAKLTVCPATADTAGAKPC